MFRRRDVSELLEPTKDVREEVADKENDEATESGTQRQPQRKMTLAEHFAEQTTRPGTSSSFRKAPEKPVVEKPRDKGLQPFKATEENSDMVAKRVLTVGQETCLKGEISNCDRVMIEGQVDANMSNVTILEITDGGIFNGTAKVGNAEISGTFDGDLEVSGRLVVYERGLVKGKVSYGEIQVMLGGRVVGQVSSPEVKLSSEKESKSKAA